MSLYDVSRPRPRVVVYAERELPPGVEDEVEGLASDAFGFVASKLGVTERPEVMREAALAVPLLDRFLKATPPGTAGARSPRSVARSRRGR